MRSASSVLLHGSKTDTRCAWVESGPAGCRPPEASVHRSSMQRMQDPRSSNPGATSRLRFGCFAVPHHHRDLAAEMLLHRNVNACSQLPP